MSQQVGSVRRRRLGATVITLDPVYTLILLTSMLNSHLLTIRYQCKLHSVTNAITARAFYKDQFNAVLTYSYFYAHTDLSCQRSSNRAWYWGADKSEDLPKE